MSTTRASHSQSAALRARRRGVMICVGVYLAAAAAAVLTVRLGAALHPLWAAALADLGATVLVFAFSAAFNNSSLYDPYWSVAPPLIALFWLVRAGSSGDPGRQWLVMALLLVWAARLTFNWVRRWRGLAHEDWRYADYRRLGAGYWPLSFAGFHLMPTVLVFLGCLPLWPALTAGGRALGGATDAPGVVGGLAGLGGLTALDALAVAVAAAAVSIEAIADRQLVRFLRTAGPGRVMDRGLWSLSRHPNYFGEVLFWWGLWLFGLAADPSWWWTIVGPAAMTALFLGISVPMMDRHLLARHPQYAGPMKRRSGLVPWFPRRR